MSATSSASDGGGGKIGGKPGNRCQRVGRPSKALDDGPAGEGRLGIGPAPCLNRAWLGARTAKGGRCCEPAAECYKTPKHNSTLLGAGSRVDRSDGVLGSQAMPVRQPCGTELRTCTPSADLHPHCFAQAGFVKDMIRQLHLTISLIYVVTHILIYLGKSVGQMSHM